MAFLFAFILFCDSVWIRFSEEIISLELARTTEQHYRGLMGRSELSENEGMLFIYEQPGLFSFWMKGVIIPLSIGFFDENRVLINTEEMLPHKMGERLKLYQNKKPALYVLEMPSGWFESHGALPGMSFEWVVQNPSNRVECADLPGD